MTEEIKEEAFTMDIFEIMKMLPHRYPFLLVDRITECVPGKYCKGYKNLTMNEEFFQGHFPNNPVMPGVLQLEAMAQCSAPILLKLPQFQGKLALYAGVENARFKNIELTKLKGPICKAHGTGTVDGKICVEADMMFALT